MVCLEQLQCRFDRYLAFLRSIVTAAPSACGRNTSKAAASLCINTTYPTPSNMDCLYCTADSLGQSYLVVTSYLVPHTSLNYRQLTSTDSFTIAYPVTRSSLI